MSTKENEASSYADAPVPIYTSLADVFGGALPTSLSQISRWNDLAEEYKHRFGAPPVYVVRAPGRVNLIGEHIDYSLFGVLPAAIEPDILIACGPSSPAAPSSSSQSCSHAQAESACTRNSPSSAPCYLPSLSPTTSGLPSSGGAASGSGVGGGLPAPGTVTVENMHDKYDGEVFTPRKEEERWKLDIDTEELKWESYVKAGYYGVLEHYFPPSQDKKGQPVPMNMLVTGSVPAGSGLSSSAAMVVASTLAFVAVNGKLDDTERKKGEKSLTKGELVKMAMENEKRVGVNSGGMDQAASILPSPTSSSSSHSSSNTTHESVAAPALYITFHPTLSASPVPLPPRAVFVIANSMVVSDKARSAKRCYNLRVVEVLVGARALGKALGVLGADSLSDESGEKRSKERPTLREVLGLWASESESKILTEDELEKTLEAILKGGKLECLKPPAGAGRTGVTKDEMATMCDMKREELERVYFSWIEVEATHFELYKRAKHVFEESLRVLQFRRTCLELSASSNEDLAVEKLGQLMNDSQTSCRDLFECSCPEIDQLVRIARVAGAVGCRLTGAGWGGCTVSLVPEDQVEDFIKKVKEEFVPYRGLGEKEVGEAICATRPGRGACGAYFVFLSFPRPSPRCVLTFFSSHRIIP